MKIGLTFGGGATRGMAHLGVLTVLDAAGIPIDVVSACSAGSVIAAVYCAGYPLEYMHKMAKYVQWRRIAQRERTAWGMFSFDRLERWLLMVLGDLEFSDLKIPLAIVAADATSGQRIVLTEGSVARAVHASCAIPGIINPVEINGHLLMDGGIVDNLPVSAARDIGADFVIASDVFEPDFKRAGGALMRGITAIETLIQHAGGGIDAADYLIVCHTAGRTFFSFKNYKELISAGEKAAAEQLPALLERLDQFKEAFV
ncbi:MAG: patatin-like phospholipase family protein [Candidatus Promineifilaceae bacterium]